MFDISTKTISNVCNTWIQLSVMITEEHCHYMSWAVMLVYPLSEIYQFPVEMYTSGCTTVMKCFIFQGIMSKVCFLCFFLICREKISLPFHNESKIKNVPYWDNEVSWRLLKSWQSKQRNDLTLKYKWFVLLVYDQKKSASCQLCTHFSLLVSRNI